MQQVVRVHIGNPTMQGRFNGTAFFIDPHTLITAKHVVEHRRDKSVYISDIPDGGVLAIDEVELCDRDIAILRVKKRFDIETFSFSDSITQGSDVNIIGFYDDFSSQKSYENRVIGYYNKEHTYELQNHLTNGLSGSPVLIDGAVCGVAVAIHRDKNITYVIPISEACVEVEFRNSGSIQKSIEEQLEEIENLIISNELTQATKIIVQTVFDFFTNKNFRREALLHQSSLKALNDDIRKFGKTADIERELKLFKNSLFEFIEILGNEYDG